MDESLIYLVATRSQRLAAAVVAVAVVFAAAVVWPHLAAQGPVLPPFVPVFATTVTVTEALTAFLLWTQYQASRRPLLLALASAYAFTSVTVLLHMVAFPGVFFAQGPFGSGRETTIWIWLIWHGGFPLLVANALARRSRGPVEDGRRRGWRAAPAIASAVGAAIALCLLAMFAHALLPALVSGVGARRHLSLTPAVLSVWAIEFAVLAFHVGTSRLRTSMDLWLAVSLLAGLVDVTLTLGAGPRYSVGWYAARTASMISAMAVLGMLMNDTSALYRRLAAAHRALQDSSARDGLTGVFNRSYFDRRYPRELALANAGNHPLSVLLVDVDHFKAYNDTFGHLAGDHCLRQIAQSLEASLRRQTDFIARYGGEEFVVVLPACEPGAALEIAGQLRRTIEGMKLPGASQGEAHVTVSIGHASRRSGVDLHPEALLAIADGALYQAKAGGRNQVRDEAA